MNEKYRYTGPNNKKCPVCNKRFETGPPVIIIHSDSKLLEHRWCLSCFNAAQSSWIAAGSERKIEQVLLPHLNRMVEKLIPEDYVVNGCWFATVPQQGLTLVMEIHNAYD
jgi:hypothetical protein